MNRPVSAPPYRRSAWRTLWRAMSVFLAVAISAFIGGFFVFADQVTSARAPEFPRADGIVALTGDIGRIDTALDLLDRQSAGRLLISGVDRNISADILRRQFPASGNLFDCCVDIGHAALDTQGNALEAREWAHERGFRSLIVVTSAYHMPRSLGEMRRALPGTELVPVPVQPAGRDLDQWMRNTSTFRLLMTEYVKYILSRLG